MPSKQDIVIAMGEFFWWKQQFERAISDGWYLLNSDLAERCKQSYLGFWLAGLSAAENDSVHFKMVQSLHTKFLEHAASIVQIALSGNLELAELNIQTGLYAKTSVELIVALREWMAAVSDDYNHGIRSVPTPPISNQDQLGG